MIHKKGLINRVRGWLPQEPLIRQRVMPSTAKPITKRAYILNTAVSLVLVFGLITTFFVLNSSWIQYSLLAIAIICGIIYLVARHRPRIKWFAKNALVPVMIFALCFAGVEMYLFLNAGYPPTFSATDPKTTLTRESMLNVSVVDIVQRIEHSPAFGLLELEYGDVRFYQMSMDAWKGGSIRVDFITEDAKHYCQFSSSNGYQYRLSVMPYSSIFPDSFYWNMSVSAQSLQQIDALGLNWFYSQAISIAESRTPNLPNIDSLNVNLAYGDEGLSVQVIGYHVTVSESGGFNGHGELISSFKPNGELQWMTQPGNNA